MRTPDLEALARAAARGDAESFAALCQLLNSEVWRYCNALTSDRDLADEASQETFLRLVPAIRRFRGASPVRPYVFAIARRAVAATIEAKVRARRDGEPIGTEPVLADHSGAVDAAVLVRALPDDLRDAFVLTQVVGLPYEQAADVCSCPVGTIRSRVYRARERLVAALVEPSDRKEVGDV